MKEYYCIRCGKKIKDEKVKTSIAKRKNPKYCDKICRLKKKQNKCLNCGKETQNPKYCSRSCSAISNNKKDEKHKKCLCCEKVIHRNSNGINCNRCSLNIKKYNFYKSVLRDKIGDKVYKLDKMVERTRVREIARKLWLLMNYPNYCEICRYDKHYEVCHIIPISNFKNEDKMFEVNKPSNLIALCRNCHWEFDHNLMDEFTKELVIKISSSRTKNY